jgi:pimeloyl-ACP methyl ester carboxylesterase
LTRHRIEVGGRRVVYREAGSGPAVLVISGLGLSGRFYDRSYPAFADAGLRLIVPDLPGFGGTRGGALGHDVEETRAFMLAFADALEVKRAVWVGHSIGAQAAIDLAAQSPHRAHGIVLVGPTGAPDHPRALHQLAALARESWRAPFPVVLRVLSDYARTSPLAYAGTWLRYAKDRPLEKLRAVQCPALVLVGTRDPVVDEEFIELLLHGLPHAEIARVPGGTHALPRSRWHEFNTATAQFCRAAAAGRR